MFKAPGSSSPFSSPESTRNDSRPSFFLNSKSNTPARPPPRSFFNTVSTTPAGPPPTSLFASANYNSAIPFSTTERDRQLDNASQDGQDDAMRSPSADSFNDLMNEDDVMNVDENRISVPRFESQEAEPGSISDGVKGMARAAAQPTAELFESDQLVLGTEQIIDRLNVFAQSEASHDSPSDGVYSSACQDLLKLWSTAAGNRVPASSIGPSSSASPIAKALFPTSLLLSLHHQPPTSNSQASFRNSRASNLPIPQILCEWLRTNHDPNAEERADVFSHRPDPCAHDRYWDVVLNSILRGEVKAAMQLLRQANFEYAATATDDGAGGHGYHGKQLGNVQRVINRVVQVLEVCPAVQRGDWNVLGADWIIFRKKVNQAVSDLEVFAEGTSADRGPDPRLSLQAEHFGLSRSVQNGASIRALSRREESKVPWIIYENLTALYGQLLGTTVELYSSAMDWLEGIVAMLIWWDGDDDMTANVNLAASRMSVTQHSKYGRSVQESHIGVYQRRFVFALNYIAIAEEPDASMLINPQSPVEVALACVFSGELLSYFEVIRGWSTLISTAVIELARMGSWLPGSNSNMRTALSNFDESDLMVLSIPPARQHNRTFKHDAILIAYADSLLTRNAYSSPNSAVVKESWVLALQVLGRLDDFSDGRKRMEKLLSHLPLESSLQVERILSMCTRLGLSDQSKATCERYADLLLERSHDFGDALYYYARSHQLEKLRNLAGLMTKSCVIGSKAFPRATDVDKTLRAMMDSPGEIMALLDRVDRRAAELLSLHVSGYGTLRKFYDLRDEELKSSPLYDQASPSTRKEAAAAALVAAIASAADSIHGGLHDSNVDSVIQVDVLLVLLGEALAVVNQPRRILKTAQIFTVLRAVEDLSTVSGSVFTACELCLDAAVEAVHNTSAEVVRKELRKCTDTLTEASRKHLLSTVLQEPKGEKARGKGGSTANSDQWRTWDWRRGLTKGIGGHDVLRILRVALAKEISRAWTAESE